VRPEVRAQRRPIRADEDGVTELDRRMAERLPIREAASIRPVRTPGQPPPPAHPATVINITVYGCGLRVPAACGLQKGSVVELGVNDTWSRARVAWVSEPWNGEVDAGLEFTALHAQFVPALLDWLSVHS
jgi:hypothetical protein